MTSEYRLAARSLLRDGRLALPAALTLALSIGAAVATFAVVDAAILRPLDYANADRLVTIVSIVRRGTPNEGRLAGLSRERADILREQLSIFDGVAAYGAVRATGTPSTPAALGRLSPEALPLLGLAPQRGRNFAADDDVDHAILLSDHCWSVTFDRDPGVVGREITLSGGTYSVVGIAPESLRYGLTNNPDVDGWLPLGRADDILVVARVRAGLSVAEAQRDLDRAILTLDIPASDWERHNGGEADGHPILELVPLDQIRGTGEMRSLLIGAALGAACVFLIACLNTAMLAVVRTLRRHRELALRSALGATRGQLIRYLVAESVTVALPAGVVGGLLGWLAIRVFPALVPSAQLSRALFVAYTPSLNGRAAAVGAGTVMISIACSTLGPLVRLKWTRISDFNGGARVFGGPWNTRLMRTMVAVQVALSLTLLTGAGTMLLSTTHLVFAPSGFDAKHLFYFDVDIHATQSNSDTEPAFRRVMETLRSAPGVAGAAFGTAPTTGGNGVRLEYQDETGATVSTGSILAAHIVGDDYFPVAGIPIVAGRAPNAEDVSPGNLVGLLDEDTARSFFGSASPLGRRYRTGPFGPWLSVIGVAAKIKTALLTQPASGESYVPMSQQRTSGIRTCLVRAANLHDVEAAIADLTRRVPVTSVSEPVSVTTLYERFLAPATFYMYILGCYAAVGLCVAVAGVYALVAEGAIGRRQEMCVRSALGATSAHLIWRTLADTALALGIGALGSVIGSICLLRVIQVALFHIDTGGMIETSACVSVVFVCVAIAALSRLVYRATRLDIARLLRV